MKKLVLAAALAATLSVPMAEPASAQRYDRYHQRTDWRSYRNYDYNRYPPGTDTYYADRYYRDGRYYRERRLSRRDRIYRGSDGRYYCRRSDGSAARSG